MSESASRLRFMPVSFFAMVMGLSGFAIAAERAAEILGLPAAIGLVLRLVAAAVFLLLAVAYGSKALRHPEEVGKELRHPIKLSFFPTISIGLILLSVAFHGMSEALSFWLLAVGVPMQLAFTLFVLSRWISQTHFQIQHSNPSWFIPVVGNILVPIAAMPFGLVELSWFFFSIGIVFWLVLLTIVFNRVIFHDPLPEKLVPTFFILVAPPAVGFLAYLKLAGGLDGFGRILFYSAAFTSLLLVVLGRRFLGLKFYLSWWAYSFPTAAFTIACLAMFKLTGGWFFEMLAWVMLAVLTAVISILVARTLLAVARGEICVED